MDLAAPLRSLIPSVDSAALEVLAGSESGLSASTIARLASRGSRQGLTKALDRLVEHGLVIAEPANRGFLYRLNRDHVLAEALLLALGARLRLFERIRGAVEQLDPTPVHAGLFGSFARADGGPGSDIDLLLVTPSGLDLFNDGWQDQLSALGVRVLAWTGNRLECLVLTADTFAAAVRDQEPIVASLLEESTYVLGQPLHELVAEPDRRNGGRR